MVEEKARETEDKVKEVVDRLEIDQDEPDEKIEEHMNVPEEENLSNSSAKFTKQQTIKRPRLAHRS